MARAAGFYSRLSVARSVSTAGCIRPEVSPHKLDGDPARNAALSSVLPVTPAELHPARSKWDGEAEGCEHRHWKCPLLPTCGTGLLPGAAPQASGNLLRFFFPTCTFAVAKHKKLVFWGCSSQKHNSSMCECGIWAAQSGGHRNRQAVRPPCFSACHVKLPLITFLNWSNSACSIFSLAL